MRRELSAVVWNVICRAEAYGLIRRELEQGGSRLVPVLISLTDGGMVAFGRDQTGSAPATALIFMPIWSGSLACGPGSLLAPSST